MTALIGSPPAGRGEHNPPMLAAGGPPDDLPPDPGASYNPTRSRLGVPADATEASAPRAPRTAHETIATGDADTLGRPAPGSAAPVAGAGAAFRLERQLGAGGFGEVWSAVQVSLDRTVAVKRLRTDGGAASGESAALEMEGLFRLEAMVTASLEHPNIVPVYDLGADVAGRPLIGMKLVRGQRWDEMLARDRVELAPADFLARHLGILIQVSQAVAFAHSRGIIHRDIKPVQIMVGEFGEVLLLDWGLAMAVGDTPAAVMPFQSLANREGTSNPAGTPAYMAPEQTWLHASGLGFHTDVYLLGGSLYQILTGRPPHLARDSREAFANAAERDVPPPETLAPDVPRELSQLALAALARRPEDRLPSVRGLLTALQDYLTGASRRAESRRLCGEAQLLAGTDAGYAPLHEAAHLTDQARTLWPENPAIVELAARVDSGLARTALASHDLSLARLHAERLASGSVRDSLLADADRQAAARAAAHRQRRLAVAAAGLLLVVVVVLSAGFAYEQRQAARALRQERDAARAARGEAEELMTFMLGDLHQGLMAVGRIDLLEPVARRAEAYYRARPQEDASVAGRRKRAITHGLLGKVLNDQGDAAASQAELDKAAAILRPLLSQQPDDVETRSALCEVLFNQAFALADRGDETQAIARYDELRQIAEEGGDATWAANALDMTGVVHYDRRRLGEALAAFERAEVAHTAGSAERSGPLLRQGVVLGEQGQGAEALRRADAGLVLLQQAFAMDPARVELHTAIAFGRTVRAEILRGLRRLDEALQEVRQANAVLAGHVERDPTNIEARYSWGQGELIEGNILHDRGEEPAARVAWTRAVDALAPAARTSNVYYDDIVARGLLSLGRVEEARPLVEKLRARGWQQPQLGELARSHGLVP